MKDSNDDPYIPVVNDGDDNDVTDIGDDDDTKSPAVAGEEDPFSGDATSSESPDIDEELQKVGLTSDEDGVRPLDVDEELEEEDQ